MWTAVMMLAYTAAGEKAEMESVGGVPESFGTFLAVFTVIIPLMIVIGTIVGAIKCPPFILVMSKPDTIYFAILWGDGFPGTFASGFCAFVVFLFLMFILWLGIGFVQGLFK